MPIAQQAQHVNGVFDNKNDLYCSNFLLNKNQFNLYKRYKKELNTIGLFISFILAFKASSRSQVLKNIEKKIDKLVFFIQYYKVKQIHQILIFKHFYKLILYKNIQVLQEIMDIQNENQPIIKEQNLLEAVKQEPDIKIEAAQPIQAEENNEANDLDRFMDEVRIGNETLFTLPADMQEQQNNLVFRQRKTRWGERQIKRSKIQQDAVFNPLQALYSGNSLLPITQYGQADIQVKLSLYTDGRRKKSKWHHQIQKTFTPPMINYIPPHISLDEIQYLLRLYRLDQLTAKINDYTPDDTDLKSPSPDPIYDKDGRRINTRQIRKRDTLHRQRVGLIQDCMKMRSTFAPPQDYKPLKKYKKIYLTEAAMNDTKANYIGKIIGPQGKTQKLIQKRTKCKIGIRGRGTNKKQKDIFQNYEAPHIIVVADTDDDLDNGVRQVHKILNGQQDDQIKQLLQSYNKIVVGMLDDNYCDNCQMEGHRTWACPFASLNQSNKANVKCQICGQISHPTSDCPQRTAYLKRQQTQQINRLLQSQYSQFKSDLNSQNTKPKGIAFLTDQRKDLLAISSDPNSIQANNQQKTSKPSVSNFVSKKKMMNPEQIILGSFVMPKFQNDD